MGLVFAFKYYRGVMASPPGNKRMVEIAGHVREGAYAYLRQQYKVVAGIFLLMAVVLSILAFVLDIQSRLVPFGFLSAGTLSGLAGFLGMRIATQASSRTAEAARHSLNRGLQVALHSGAVMGLVVVGLALLDLSLWFFFLRHYTNLSLDHIVLSMLCFGMGASFQALFARVGGGIYTKAADVGADLVGKVEANIPEDDPRNPAVIADNVGDNVGDVAGMGADLYESYYGSILAANALGVTAGLGIKAVVLPMSLAGLGVILSIIGFFVVKTPEHVSQKALLQAFGRGVNLSSFLILIVSAVLIYVLVPEHLGLWGSVASGLIAGVIIGRITEYYTSDAYSPTREIADSALTGPATVILSGISTGMLSTAMAGVTITLGIMLAFTFAEGFANLTLGLYGIAIAAVGMLSTLGITLATDAYGPVADNAGGNAQMSGLPPEVRERTEMLDALGNTTAATGKGFAIGSAALTAMALLAAYVGEIHVALERSGVDKLTINGRTVDVHTASFMDFMEYYNVTLMNPKVLVGVMLGAMVSFVFSALAIRAVGRAAQRMVEEVRRQFREIKGIMAGKAKPDYAACVAISTSGAQRAMMLPAMLAILMPVAVGLLLGVPAVMGLLVGSLSTGFLLAIFMANSGGAWDNAKKYIERGAHGGKGSPAHKAAVVGDTVGDPFKDTAGPSLNILVKLMAIVSVVFAGVVVSYSPKISAILHLQ
ncbi:MAG: sodium-translocating pyrophosphatase [Planctomycetes bacterium RIFCSPHIGHO2_12_FULL_52_36]|nr:MAG: sodium-translocating pyrophosphatase [Planctomycetes bacterium RIFCSPHIGHO2_02_FULL_52_58]OHB93517.1 MAG: sodium-translocating pyrophosphatase [Planctomycetes bacterium RIFCSPHIGHO2_12_FULL_52_36]